MKKPFYYPTLIALLVAIIGTVIQLATLGGEVFGTAVLFIATIGIGIYSIIIIKKRELRGIVWSVFAIILGLGGLFNVVSGVIIKNKIQQLEQPGTGVSSKIVLSIVGNALINYRNENGICPNSIEELYPKFLVTKDFLYDDEGNSLLRYQITPDKKNCDVAYGVKFGVGL